jgi:hypothetical protein
MENMYLVCPGVQKASLDKLCHGECGKILIGAIELCDVVFFPCGADDCEYTEKTGELGVFELTETGLRNLVIRRLVEI